MSSESEAAVKKSEGKNQLLKSLGKYVIERKLGQGGMGTVYLAKHSDLKKLVALKVLPQDKAKNPILVRRFKAEAQAAAQLEHPNIVAVYDTGEAEGYLYIAMEYVDGIDLFEQVKRRGVIPVKRSIEIIKQVAAALQEASKKNIVHRDIKPSNLLLRQDGTVKVTDLGLARSIDDTLETDITRAGTTVGTVDYMAPEQARNSKLADIRSDIYSLGCTWYQMLTGEPPFPDGSLTNKLQAHALKPLPDPREKNENIPEGVFAVLQRMTAKKPDERYQTPGELLEDLSRAKLTKAAFSNEIFSDLSDSEISTVPGPSDEDVSDNEDAEGEFETHVDERPKHRARSRVEPDSDEHEVEPVRRKRRAHVDDEEEEVDKVDEPTRRKSRPHEVETKQTDDTQPIKSRQKPSTRSRVDDESDDAIPDTNRSSKKSHSRLDDEEVEDAEEPSSKRKKNNHAVEDNKPATSKNSKAASTNAAAKKDSAKGGGPKPLPPKRQPIVTEEVEQNKLNLESLKYLGIAVGVIGVICGIGWLIYSWSSQFDKVPVAKIEVQQAPAATTVPKPTKGNDPAESNSVVVNVVDPPKTETTDQLPSEYDISKQPMPAWVAAESPEPRDIPVLTVGPGVATDTHFVTLDDALRVAGKNGAVVRLIGSGPFSMSPVELAGGKKLVLTSATPKDEPLIILKPGGPTEVRWLSINNSTLELRGVHFVVDRVAIPKAGPQADPLVMIAVTDGQLYVRSCSFTATGQDAVDIAALGIFSIQDSQNHPPIEPDVLLNRVTIRGNGLTGLRVHRVNANVVIQDSLLVTGTAPSIDVAGHMVAGLADAPLPKPRRTIRVLRTTLCARKQVIELGAANVSKPPTTAILFQDSVCSAEGSGHSTVLATALHWPHVTSSPHGWLTNLSWTSLSSLYLGFDRLLDLDRSSFKVAKLDDWQRVWGKKYAAAQFQPMFWQESTIADLSTIMPFDFDTAKIPYHDVKTGAGGLPGCPVDQLKVPDVISETRLFAISQRPKLPAVVAKPADAVQTKKVDLTKEDLGAVLNRSDWQSGTVFEASGSGLRSMSPAKISGKSLRIVFLQGDGPLLKLQPKIPDQKAKPDFVGLFNIENGSLDLQSGILEASQSVKGAAPPWLISAKNASVIIRGCQLNGPLLQDLEQHQGLIQWTTTATTPPAAGAELPFLSVNDSLLLSTGVGIRAECSQGNVFVRNSIVAVRGSGLGIVPVRTNNKLLANIDLQHVTFSATKAAIRIEAAAGAEEFPSPMRLYIDYCAVVSPLAFKSDEAAEAAVAECVGPVREQKQIEWWGTSNGIAKEVRVFLRQSKSDPITSLADWNAAWGEAHVVRMLTGTKGVQLNLALPTKWLSLKAASFALDPKSAGATWADGGGPVGANFHEIEDAMASKKTATDTKPGAANVTPKNQAPKKPNDIGF